MNNDLSSSHVVLEQSVFGLATKQMAVSWWRIIASGIIHQAAGIWIEINCDSFHKSTDNLACTCEINEILKV